MGLGSACWLSMDDATRALAYRPIKLIKEKDLESVREMDRQTYPDTFDNLDNGYMAITPHTRVLSLWNKRRDI